MDGASIEGLKRNKHLESIIFEANQVLRAHSCHRSYGLTKGARPSQLWARATVRPYWFPCCESKIESDQ